MSEATLSVDILCNTAQLTQGLGQASNSVDKFKDKTGESGSIISKVTGLLGGMSGAFGMLAGLAGVGFAGFSLFKELSNISSLGKTAAVLGSTVESFSALSYAAKKSGIDLEEFQEKSQHMMRTLDEARNGSEGAAKAFGRLGLDATKVGAQSFEDQIRLIAESISKLPDQASKTAAAMELFGRGAGDMIPFLSKGAKGIDDLVAKAKASGFVIGQDSVEQYKKFKVAIADLSDIWTGLFRQVAVAVAPALAKVGEFIQTFMEKGRELFAFWQPVLEQYKDIWMSVFSAIGEILQEAYQVVLEVVQEIGQALGINLTGSFKDLREVITRVLTQIEFMTMNWKDMILLVLATLSAGLLKWANDITEAFTGERPFEAWQKQAEGFIFVLRTKLAPILDDLLTKRLDALNKVNEAAVPKGLPDAAGNLATKGKGVEPGAALLGSTEAANIIAKITNTKDDRQVKELQKANDQLGQIVNKLGDKAARGDVLAPAGL